ncbi:MAG: hypothetical protein AAFU58_05045 [Pseudomonadota bacterium]
MMALGRDCALWDESVDYANLDDFPDRQIPENRFVLTTWHENEPREEVLWFAQHAANHPSAVLKKLALFDICQRDRSSALLTEFSIAHDLADQDPL